MKVLTRWIHPFEFSLMILVLASIVHARCDGLARCYVDAVPGYFDGINLAIISYQSWFVNGRTDRKIVIRMVYDAYGTRSGWMKNQKNNKILIRRSAATSAKLGWAQIIEYTNYSGKKNILLWKIRRRTNTNTIQTITQKRW